MNTQIDNACFFDDGVQDVNPMPMIRNVSEDNFMFPLSFYPNQSIQEIKIFVPVEPTCLNQQFQVPNFVQYKRPRIEKKVRPSMQRKDYKKNICGYITKKIVREFMSSTYRQKVQHLCKKYQCDYEQMINYYDKKIQRITGPTHLDMLLNSAKQDRGMKKCFKEFFIWFLRHRYLRYLLSQGKMAKKEVYVDYKNKTLLYLGSMEQDMEYNMSNFGQSQSKQTLSMNYGN